jgi:hypothetical protein
MISGERGRLARCVTRLAGHAFVLFGEGAEKSGPGASSNDMGNTFPSEKRHNWRVYSPAFRGKNGGHSPLESVTHVIRLSRAPALPDENRAESKAHKRPNLPCT